MDAEEQCDQGFAPDDPAYQHDPTYDGRPEMTLWTELVGPIPPAQQMMAQNALIRLHGYCQRSLPELRALIQHVGGNRKAREFWGSPKSPSGWLRTREDGTQTWQVIRAHWLRSGGQLPHAEPTRDEVLARTQYQPVPPPSAWDRECIGLGRGCYRGHVRDAQNRRVPCPTCALGAWVRDYQTSPEVLAAMELSACGVAPQRIGVVA